MPLSYATFTGNSGSPQNTFTIPFNYILKDHIKVYYGRDILANTQTSLLVSGTDYNFTSDTTIQLIGSTINSGTTTGNPHNLANSVVLTLERDTPDSSQIVSFADGSNLIGDNLNNANLQNLFVVQEQQDKNDLSAAKSISAETASTTATNNVATLSATQFRSDGSQAMTGDLNAGNNKVKNVSDPTNAQDAVTKAYLERTGSIQSAQILDGTIVDGDINASANIAGSKVQAASGSNPGTLSASDKSKLDGIESSAKDDQTGAEIKSLYEGESDTNAFSDAEKTKLSGIESSAKDDQTGSEIKSLYESQSDTNAFTDAEKTKLSGVAAGAEVNVQADFNASSGDALILNKPSIPSGLNDLTDVDTTGIADNKILKYQASSSKFVIADDSGGGGGSSTFSGLSDTPTNYTGAAGKTVKVNAAGNALEFVTVTTPNTDLDQDSSPQLAANLDVQTNEITTSTTNGNVKLNPNGTGVVEVKGDGSSADGTIQLNCSQNSHGIKLKSPPHSAGASYTFTFPQNIQNGQFLTTDANGNTSWSAIDLTALSASNLTSGTVPDARFPATLPAASAANLTTIPAANITGTLPAISAANLTNIPAANITGTLPAIDGSNLTGIVAGATGGGTDQAFFEGDQNVTTSYTLTANKNAMAISPTIASGATITVPSGAILVIL